MVHHCHYQLVHGSGYRKSAIRVHFVTPAPSCLPTLARWLGGVGEVTKLALYSVSQIFNFAQCTPVNKLWEPDIPGSCWPREVAPRYNTFAAGESLYHLLDNVLCLFHLTKYDSLFGSSRYCIGVSSMVPPREAADEDEREDWHSCGHELRCFVSHPAPPSSAQQLSMDVG